MYSYGPPHMAVQKQDDQHEHTFSSYVRIRDVVLKTCLGRWTIGRSGERGSGISVLPARHDDDEDFLARALADRLSGDFEWQQVFSNLQDSSQYSDRSHQCCSLDGLHWYSNFKVLQSLYNSFVTVPSAPIATGITVTFMFHSFSIL